MEKFSGVQRLVRPFALVAPLLAFGLIGCASHEPLGVRNVAIQDLRCAPDDVYAVLNRTTPKVREWIVGCEFYYRRVLCSDAGCAPAGPKPPCLGELQCFDEDPVTLEWTMPRTAMREPDPAKQ
jgi:hypothetical protein